VKIGVYGTPVTIILKKVELSHSLQAMTQNIQLSG
jgi:hypothetical protein